MHAGVYNGATLGTPICVVVPNKDQQSKDYTEMDVAYRPSHADATYDMKYGIRAVAGGGRSSARETIGRVAAGAIAKKLLHTVCGTEVGQGSILLAWPSILACPAARCSLLQKWTALPHAACCAGAGVRQWGAGCGGSCGPRILHFGAGGEQSSTLSRPCSSRAHVPGYAPMSAIRTPSATICLMKVLIKYTSYSADSFGGPAAIDAVRTRGDSCGGVVTCVVRSCPTGLGSPVFAKLEAELAQAVMSLPASKVPGTYF